MKLTHKLSLTGGLLGALFVVASCSKVAERLAEEQIDMSNTARVQLYNVAVGTQRNFLYVDGERLNGSSLTYTNATFAPLFPSTANSFAVKAGLRSFVVRDTLVTSTQPPLTFSESFDGNAFYTIFLYDTANKVKQKTVRTEIEVPTDTTARIRVANFAWLAAGVPPPIDIFSKRRNEMIFTNVNYTDVTDFIPYASISTDSLIVFNAGTSTALDTAVMSFQKQRVYTLVFRGRYITNGSGGGTFPRTLTSFVNY